MQEESKDWQSKLITSMAEGEKYLATSNIIRETSNIDAAYTGCAERAINSLFLMNSGGTITVLAYIYHARGCSASVLLSISLVMFLIGLILAFDVVARDFYYMKTKSLEFHGDVKSFMLGAKHFSEIRRFKISQVADRSPRITIILGEFSAYCAVAGIFVGLMGHFFS